jgi:hypothetical protein
MMMMMMNGQWYSSIRVGLCVTQGYVSNDIHMIYPGLVFEESYVFKVTTAKRSRFRYMLSLFQK